MSSGHRVSVNKFTNVRKTLTFVNLGLISAVSRSPISRVILHMDMSSTLPLGKLISPKEVALAYLRVRISESGKINVQFIVCFFFFADDRPQE